MSEFWTPVICFLIPSICVEITNQDFSPSLRISSVTPPGKCSPSPYLFLSFTHLPGQPPMYHHSPASTWKEGTKHCWTISALWMYLPSPGTPTISASIGSAHYYQSISYHLLKPKLTTYLTS
ncbi:hypothetical protein AMECASPLE_011233 [Ameca splendens]|uniref:Uncharacterized protein n=1 Tax=Ameca splendens TaxID=208324 RepID=A0ABV0Z9J2_9TELE